MNGSIQFERWLADFKAALIKAGLSRHQAAKYDNVYRGNAKRYFTDGATADDAAFKELIP